MRIFQYKIIHLIHVLLKNKLLHVYILRDNSCCDVSPNVIDTLEHTFHYSPIIFTLLYIVAIWLSPKLDLYRLINTENVLIGIPYKSYILENSIIIHIKKYM